jgi:hypothetical protein
MFDTRSVIRLPYVHEAGDTMTTYRKYPRTYHFPWSPGATSDDKVHQDVEALFSGREVVTTEKLDGENTTIYADNYCHARSIDSAHHPSRAWVKALAAQVGPDLPEGWRVCGENLFAKHSLGYDKLETYFYVFGIYDQDNRCLSWDETVEWAALLGLQTVPVLYRGPWDADAIQALWTGKSVVGEEGEGYVVRVACGFAYEDFARSTAKYVRCGHVTTENHWMKQTVVPNSLRTKETP